MYEFEELRPQYRDVKKSAKFVVSKSAAANDDDDDDDDDNGGDGDSHANNAGRRRNRSGSGGESRCPVTRLTSPHTPATKPARSSKVTPSNVAASSSSASPAPANVAADVTATTKQ